MMTLWIESDFKSIPAHTIQTARCAHTMCHEDSSLEALLYKNKYRLFASLFHLNSRTWLLHSLLLLHGDGWTGVLIAVDPVIRPPGRRRPMRVPRRWIRQRRQPCVFARWSTPPLQDLKAGIAQKREFEIQTQTIPSLASCSCDDVQNWLGSGQRMKSTSAASAHLTWVRVDYNRTPFLQAHRLFGLVRDEPKPVPPATRPRLRSRTGPPAIVRVDGRWNPGDR